MMQRGSTTMDAEVPVKLNTEEILERADTMANKLVHIGNLRKKRREDLRSINALIESELDEVQRLARVIAAQEELRKQADLRFGDAVTPSTDEARAALATVAETAGEPKPSEPHVYISPGVDGAPCVTCGSGKDDPVHAAVEPWVEGLVRANDAAMVAKACSRCAKTLTTADTVLHDGEIKPVCETCVRAAIEAGTWPHRFELREGIGVASKSSKCRLCKRRQDDDVHSVPPAENASPGDANASPTEQDPAYDFDGSEPAPAVIASHRAIEEPAQVDEPAEGGGAGA